MTDPVRIIVRDRGDHTVVAPQGRLYFDTVHPLRDALLLIAAADQPHIVLDLSEVPLCDSSGLNLMVQTHRLATRRGGWLRLAGPQPGVRRVLEATNLTQLLSIYDTLTAATDSDA